MQAYRRTIFLEMLNARLCSNKRKGGEFSPAIAIAINVSNVPKLNANPTFPTIRVLRTIPSDSPQLTAQKETRAVRKYMDPDR